MHVILLGHGSRDPRHAELVEAVAAELNARSLRASVGSAFLDLCPPTLPEAVRELPAGEDVILVPMLLTAAFHARVDVPAAVEAAARARPDLTFRTADVLGPAPQLVAAMERRILEAGADPDDPTTGVLLVAAGTSDADARSAVAEVARDWLAAPRRGTHAFAAGDGPTVDEGLRDLVARGASTLVVAPYLLASGVLPDRAFALARSTAVELGVDLVVADVIGDAPELLDLVPERARNAAS